jgi:hypothetical protein
MNLAPEKRKGFRVVEGLFNTFTGTLKPEKTPYTKKPEKTPYTKLLNLRKLLTGNC